MPVTWGCRRETRESMMARRESMRGMWVSTAARWASTSKKWAKYEKVKWANGAATLEKTKGSSANNAETRGYSWATAGCTAATLDYIRATLG